MHLPARSIAVVAAGLFLSSLILGALGVFAFPTAVSDFLGSVTGIKESAIKAVVDPATGKIPLRLLPQGEGSGLDADLLDGQHGSFYATADSLRSISDKVADLAVRFDSLPTSSGTTYVSKLNDLTGPVTLAAGTGLSLSTSGSVLTLDTAGIPYASLNLVGSITNADISGAAAIAYPKLALGNSILSSDIFDGTITAADISATAGIPYGALNLVGSIANADVSSTAAIAYSKLNLAGSITNADIASSAAVAYSKLALAGQIVGGDLASGISISTNGSIATTGTGTITSAGLLTASTGLTLSAGALTLPATSIADSSLSANVALLSATQTFSGAKTFSQALSAPTTGSTLNGLIINAGALSGITTLSASGGVTLASLTSSAGSVTSTVADGASAIGFLFQTSTTYATAGAKLLSPEDFAPLVWDLVRPASGNFSTSSTSFSEVDARNLAVNVFSPFDGVLTIEPLWNWSNTSATNNVAQPTVGGTALAPIGILDTPSANVLNMFAAKWAKKVAAGKHRVSFQWKVAAGTLTIEGIADRVPRMTVTLTKGK